MINKILEAANKAEITLIPEETAKIAETIVSHKTSIDWIEVKNWSERQKTRLEKIQYKVNYFIKSFISNVQSGQFDAKESLERHDPPRRVPRAKINIKFECQEKTGNNVTWIECMITYCSEHGIPSEELQDIVDKITHYKPNITAEEFVQLFKRSKFAKNHNIDTTKIDEEAERQRNEWIELLKQYKI